MSESNGNITGSAESPKRPSGANKNVALHNGGLPQEVLRAISKSTENGGSVTSIELQAISALSHQGPLPPAELLSQYREVNEGLPEQIIGWADMQIHHRISLEREVTLGAERRKARGQFGSMFIAALGLALASYVAIYGNPYAASIIGIVAVGGPTAATILSARLPMPPPRESRPDQPNKPTHRQNQGKRSRAR